MPAPAIPRIDNVLVIGGCGFLGHHIVQQLLDSGSSSISVLDLRTTRNRLSGVTYYNGDITSSDDVTTVLEKVKPAAIIHTASPVASAGNPDSLYDLVNVKGTQNLVTCAGAAGCVKAFVYTSSASIIHDTVSDQFDADESWPVLKTPVQKDYYAHTKGIADQFVLASNKKYGDMLTACLRPAGIFGEGDVQLIPGTLQVLKEGKTGFQLGDNTNRFDFTYVGNVSYAHLLAANALLQTHGMETKPLDYERVDGEAFFVTNDQPVPFWDMMRAVWSAGGWKGGKPWVIGKEWGLLLASLLEWVVWIASFGKKEPTLTRRKVKYSCMNRTYNIEKVKYRLSYTPLVSLEEGVRRGVEWFREQEGANKHAESAAKKNA
ncbi:MAG: erg26, C-3 sterol dehydrogenase [Stictis urceolatum]|nr:erg26, C-3 sterol dehydrogenase [Stictis urceolata]